MSIFDSIFGTYGGNAENTLKGAQRDLKNTYAPYMNAGTNALPQFQGLISQLTQNPGAFLNQMGQSYQQSPGFQFSVDQATNAAKNAAAASGMAGSPAVQNALAQQITGFANQDYGNWMNNAMGLFGQGYSGLGGLYNTGFNAANAYGGNITSLQNALAQLQYTREANQAQSTGGGIGGLLGMFM